MGQKNGHTMKHSDTSRNILSNKKSNIFDDAVDLEEESEILKIGNTKVQQCPYCKKKYKYE